MPVRRSAAQSIGQRLGLLRQVDFQRLWVGETISQFGSQVSLLAIPYIASVLLQATPFEVALLGALQFLPFLLFTLPAGAWVDRLRRRPILISGDLVRVVALGTIPVAWGLGVLTIWQLYLVSFVAGIATVFFDVAYQVVNACPTPVGRATFSVLNVQRHSASPVIGSCWTFR